MALAYQLSHFIALNRKRGDWRIYDIDTRKTYRTDDYGDEIGRATNRREAIKLVKAAHFPESVDLSIYENTLADNVERLNGLKATLK